MTFTIKQNDTSPALTATLKDDDGNVIDISGATVKFNMIKVGEVTAKINASATVVNASGGQVKYQWSGSDTDTIGVFKAEWEVTYSDSTIETFPNNDNMIINIFNDLA